jgi:hypothetical protein
VHRHRLLRQIAVGSGGHKTMCSLLRKFLSKL